MVPFVAAGGKMRCEPHEWIGTWCHMDESNANADECQKYVAGTTTY